MGQKHILKCITVYRVIYRDILGILETFGNSTGIQRGLGLTCKPMYLQFYGICPVIRR